jgi:hypothetical protein
LTAGGRSAVRLCRPSHLRGPRGTPVPDIASRGQAGGVGRVVGDPLTHRLARSLALFLAPGTLFPSQRLFQGLYEVVLGAQQHAAYEVGCRDAGRALDDLESAGLLDEAVAVLTAAVRGDVVAVNYIPASIVCYPG